MSQNPLPHAERLAQRLIDGEADGAIYHELRFEAMALAHAWHSEWLAEELVATFDKAAQDHRPHGETAAVVQGLLRGVRLARAHGAATSKTPAWANPAVAAAGVTTLGLIVAAMINQYGGMKAASHSQAVVQPAVVKPQIQIVLPSTAANATPPPQTATQPSPVESAHAAPAAKPSAAASPAPATKSSSEPAAPAEAGEPPPATTGGT